MIKFRYTFMMFLTLPVAGLHAENIAFAPNAGVIDITNPPYNAAGDGKTDDTAAIQKALNDHANGNRIIYLPEGTYLVSGTLKWGPGKHGGMAQKRTILQGQNRDTTVIRLMDACPGFQDEDEIKAVIWTGNRPAQRFRNAIRNLTVNTGTGNDGAAGIQFNASNQGTIRSVHIISGDGKGKIGLDMVYTDEVGPLLVRDLTVTGFDVGIKCGHTVNSQTFENITLVDQNICGIENDGQVVNVRNLRSFNAVPAVKNGSGSGCMTIIDASLIGKVGASRVAAVENDATMFARNIRASGYGRTLKNNGGHGHSPESSIVREFSSHPPISQFSCADKSLNLPVKDTPAIAWDDSEDWAVVTDFNAVGDGKTDDTDSFQAALDCGKPTVCIPGGKTFRIEGTVYVRGDVRRIIGCEARLKGKGAIVFTDEISAPVVVFERFNISYSPLKIRHESSKTLILSSAIVASVESAGSGDFFIDDVCGGPWVFSNPDQNIWARQINPENSETPKITNNGADLWILGLKTEKANICVDMKNGGRTEILGAHIYAQGGEKTTPMMRIDNSKASFACVRETNWSTDKQYTDYVEEIRGSESRILKKSDAPKGGAGTGRVIPLYIGYDQ